jgi:hypothetical protein
MNGVQYFSEWNPVILGPTGKWEIFMTLAELETDLKDIKKGIDAGKITWWENPWRPKREPVKPL